MLRSDASLEKPSVTISTTKCREPGIPLDHSSPEKAIRNMSGVLRST